MIISFALLALFLQTPALNPSPPLQTGVVQGAVTRGGTGEPATGIIVTLTEISRSANPDGARNVLGQSLPVSQTRRTDDAGRFLFDNLVEGSYLLRFEGNGYVNRDYLTDPRPGWFKPFNLSAGQNLTDIAVSLIPTATLSGRTLTPERKPAPLARVQLLRYAYNHRGERTVQALGLTISDDNGEYRFYHVTPGRYLLAAGAEKGPLVPAGSLSTWFYTPLDRPSEPDWERSYPGMNMAAFVVNGSQKNYAQRFYPGVSDPDLATMIDLRPGSDVSGIDLTLEPAVEYRIRGRVTGPGNVAPPTRIRLSLNSRSAEGARVNISRLEDGDGVYDTKSGVFELRGIGPGAYTLSAMLVSGANPADRFYAVVSPVIVTNADVTDVLLPLAPGATVTGRVTMDGRPFPAAGVTLKSSIPGESPEYFCFQAPELSSADTQPTTFMIGNLKPGEYQVDARCLPEGYYVKEATFEGVDALNHPLQIAGSMNGLLLINVSPNTGTVEGVVTNEKREPAEDILVVLVPDDHPERVELFRVGVTDKDGKFRFAKVVPGDYKVFAWTTLESYGYFDPEILRRDSRYATEVQVTESSRTSVRVRVVPATEP